MVFKVAIDAEKCIGCGACVAIAENIFEMEGDKAIVKVTEQEDNHDAQEAIEGCPVECISIKEE